jgi:T5orf172 domain
VRFFVFGPRVFGLRTGLSLGREDWAKLNAQPRSAATGIDADHGFIYVITDGRGLCKIGITTNPNARLAQLQYQSAAPLSFAWIGAPKEQTIAIERSVHGMLAQYRRNGEWFEVAPDAAVGAIHAAAFRRNLPVLDLDLDKAEQIRQIGYQLATNKPPSSALGRVAVGVLQLLAGFALAGALLVFVLIRFGRMI